MSETPCPHSAFTRGCDRSEKTKKLRPALRYNESIPPSRSVWSPIHFKLLGCLHTIYVTRARLPPQSLSRLTEGYIGVAPGRSACLHLLSIICITVMLSQQTSLASPCYVSYFTTPSLLRMRFTSDSLSPHSLYTLSLSWTLWKGT